MQSLSKHVCIFLPFLSFSLSFFLFFLLYFLFGKSSSPPYASATRRTDLLDSIFFREDCRPLVAGPSLFTILGKNVRLFCVSNRLHGSGNIKKKYTYVGNDVFTPQLGQVLACHGYDPSQELHWISTGITFRLLLLEWSFDTDARSFFAVLVRVSDAELFVRIFMLGPWSSVCFFPPPLS